MKMMRIPLNALFSSQHGEKWYSKRCDRKDYWSSMLLLFLFSVLVFIPQYLWNDYITDNLFVAQLVVDTVLGIFVLCLSICLSLQRLNDVGVPLYVIGCILSFDIVAGWLLRYYDQLSWYYIINGVTYIIILGLCCLERDYFHNKK